MRWRCCRSTRRWRGCSTDAEPAGAETRGACRGGRPRAGRAGRRRCARSRPSPPRRWTAMRCAPPMSPVPARLTVIGEAPAGTLFAGAVGAGEAVRIFTGAPVPEGADTIAHPGECARARRRRRSRSFETVAAGRHIRARRARFRRRRRCCSNRAACSMPPRCRWPPSANHPRLPVVAQAAGRDHRHRRRTAAAGQRRRARTRSSPPTPMASPRSRRRPAPKCSTSASRRDRSDAIAALRRPRRSTPGPTSS